MFRGKLTVNWIRVWKEGGSRTVEPGEWHQMLRSEPISRDTDPGRRGLCRTKLMYSPLKINSKFWRYEPRKMNDVPSWQKCLPTQIKMSINKISRRSGDNTGSLDWNIFGEKCWENWKYLYSLAEYLQCLENLIGDSKKTCFISSERSPIQLLRTHKKLYFSPTYLRHSWRRRPGLINYFAPSSI